MAEKATKLSLLFAPEDVRRVPAGFGRTLASHLLGSQLERGDRVALPGWPVATVDAIEPERSEVGPGTEITVHVPPAPTQGALSMVMLVDASLTMGKGDVSPFHRAASTVDAFLLNGRSFVQSAGIVVQGGSTRQVEPLAPPEEVSGASILKVQPRGTFDLDAGIEQTLDLLADARAGPRAVVAFTDGDDPPRDPLKTARPVVHAGVTFFALTPEAGSTFVELCEITGGLVSDEAQEVFQALAELTGSEGDWTPPEEPVPSVDEETDYEFEVVIEAMEGSTR